MRWLAWSAAPSSRPSSATHDGRGLSTSGKSAVWLREVYPNTRCGTSQRDPKITVGQPVEDPSADLQVEGRTMAVTGSPDGAVRVWYLVGTPTPDVGPMMWGRG
jgi:hypothetical protein